jgi:hypothetical protein
MLVRNAATPLFVEVIGSGCAITEGVREAPRGRCLADKSSAVTGGVIKSGRNQRLSGTRTGSRSEGGGGEVACSRAHDAALYERQGTKIETGGTMSSGDLCREGHDYLMGLLAIDGGSADLLVLVLFLFLFLDKSAKLVL